MLNLHVYDNSAQNFELLVGFRNLKYWNTVHNIKILPVLHGYDIDDCVSVCLSGERTEVRVLEKRMRRITSEGTGECWKVRNL